MSEYDITLPCMNGFTLHAKGQNLIVATKRGEEIFPISKIQSFALKEPRGLSQGTVTFRTAQAATAGVSLGFGFGASIGAEKNFFYQKRDLGAALALRDYVTSYEERQRSADDTAAGAKVVSVVEEIRGRKGLLDDGILTQEEFDAKKRQLLGL